MGAMLDLSRADSKLLSNKDYDKVKNILQEAIDTAQQGRMDAA